MVVRKVVKRGSPWDENKVRAVMELHLAGMSYADIARTMKVSRQAVRQMVLRAKNRNAASESYS
jgi:DNA-directed RNA polymerase specialized sigma24 family protein